VPVSSVVPAKTVDRSQNAGHPGDGGRHERGAHALAVLTEWDEFTTFDFAKIHGLMTRPAVVFNGRKILDLARLRTLGCRTCGIGRSA